MSRVRQKGVMSLERSRCGEEGWTDGHGLTAEPSVYSSEGLLSRGYKLSQAKGAQVQPAERTES